MEQVEGPDQRPLLVANLIVRDEEAMVEDCLASLEGLVDRIEVTDTGSVDRTPDLVRAAGLDLRHATWTDDFAAARNHVLERSRDAWFVLWIDADERVVCDDPVAVRRLLASVAGDVDGFTVPLRNVAADGSTVDTFEAIRVFATSGTTFAGAIHEQVVVGDRAVSGSSLPGIELSHLGYRDAASPALDKGHRNLEIARRVHAESPGPAAALELARALLLVGGDPRRAAELLEEADAGAGDQPVPLRAHIAALLGRVHLQLGDRAVAMQHAMRALDLVPADDLAAVVFAEAAIDAGATGDLVALAARISGAPSPKPVFVVDANRHRYLGLVAVARVIEGDVEAGVAQAIEVAAEAGTYPFWERLLGAVADRRPDDVVDVLHPLTLLDHDGVFVGPAASVLAPLVSAELCARYVEGGGTAVDAVASALVSAVVVENEALVRRLAPFVVDLPSEMVDAIAATAVERGFVAGAAALRGDADVTSADVWIDASHLAGLVPPGRRVVDVTPTGEVGTLVDRSTVDHRDPATLDGRYDVAIVGTSYAHGAPGWDRDLRAALDGAGMVLAWDEVVDPPETFSLHIGSGSADAASPTASIAGSSRHHLEAAGYLVESIGHVHVGRPPWSTVDIERAADRVVSIEQAAVVIVSPESLPSEIEVAYAASLPETVAINVVQADGGTFAVPTLHVDANLMPEPSWVQSLWDQAVAGSAAGGRVAATDGRLLHAGADRKGLRCGDGVPVHHPVAATDRVDAGLLRPFALPAGARPLETPVGRLLGRATAVGVRGETVTEGAALTAVYPEAVFVVGDLSLGEMDATARVTLLDVCRALVESGHPVVYRWSSGVVDPWGSALLRGAGVVPFAHDPSAPGESAPGVAGAFAPRGVVYLTERGVEDDYPTIVAVHPKAWTIYAGEDSAMASRADLVRPLDSPTFVTEVVDLLQRPLVDRDPAPATIDPIDARSGVVSVVIPVWNNWELTAACLDSLDRYAEAELEVIVVDNGSTDGTPIGLADRDVRVIANDENRGFPIAVNQGIAASSGEFVCVLNNDTEVTEGWLTEMLETLATPGTGVVGPRTNRVSGLQAVADAPALVDTEAARTWAATWHATRGGSWLINRLVGFCLLARRSLFEELGGFDEGFGIGNYEDDELGSRVRGAGLDLRVADGAVVLHHGSATFENLDLDYAALLGRAARVHGGGRPPSGLLSAVVLGDGDPHGVLTTAHQALSLADRVRIVERTGPALTELHTGALAHSNVEVVASDWSTDEGARRALEGIEDRLVLVCAAGERVEVEDVGRVRVDLERLDVPAAIATDGGFEVRIAPPSDDTIEVVGSTSETRLPGLRIGR